jgi:hypothetical protein
MQSIIDKRNFTIDGVSIDGFFNCHNPLAFAAGTKNNPDILSQAQMFRASNRVSHRVEPDGSVTRTMTQSGLIDQILEDDGLVGDKVTHKRTPAKEVLQPHPNAAPFNAPWQYQSVIGKLNFLTQNTRPDISMAVHMCARFVTNPN